ncbi:hypothetical protein QVZ41_13620 [Wenyingzhuangia sp. chi5]|uniref:General secretion pathway protein n=1 Tax=Wenyingzhuangia gilva TaxID=3057677 RepID=A0ABT8VV73_9FLAO|nr:hypothetical protein [Wenyingzhuangia sp. chi5]MDO3695884.1 hypothetical protein [Wenyingzhuangia sp. chi5]
MFQNLKTYLLFGTHFCGVEHTTTNGNPIIYTSLLKKSKNKVDVENCFASKELNEVATRLHKKQALFLIINNEHVLTKVLDNEQSGGLKSVNKAFPNINISDFYYEIIQQKETIFISICRKSYVNTLIDQYHQLGFYITCFSLGNNIMSSTVSFIDKPLLKTSNALLTIEASCLKKIEYKDEMIEEAYDMNGLKVLNLYMLSTSAALSSILNQYQSETNAKEQIEKLLFTFKQTRFFNQFLKFGLTFILCLLLINFLLFNFYYNKVESLNQTAQLNQSTKIKMIKLKEEVTKAKKTTDDILKSSTSKSSFYVNQMIQSIPNSILLSELSYQPLQKRVKENKPILIEENIILISGESNNSVLYSNWIALLESKEWVKKVEVLSYSDAKKSISFFSIKIKINS